MRRLRSVPVLAVLLGVSCQPIPAGSMSEIAFPPGFRLETAHTAVLRVGGDPAAAAGAHLVVRTPEGQPLYDGSAALAVRHPLGLRVPDGTAEVQVTVRRDGAPDVTDRVPLVDQEGAYTLVAP